MSYPTKSISTKIDLLKELENFNIQICHKIGIRESWYYFDVYCYNTQKPDFYRNISNFRNTFTNVEIIVIEP